MVPLRSYPAFVRQLEDREYFGQKLGLTRIRKILERLGNPEKSFRSVHIAGTNGKGSTAAMIAQILAEADCRVGLYTSPHLVDFCERIRIGGELISPDQVLHYARMIREVEDQADTLTFFELATVLCFLHFAEAHVDLAVVETGLGGRLDATNVVTPLVSVITTIGMDHTWHLGDTLAKIAFEKAGIIKEGVPVVVGLLPQEAMQVVREIATRMGSEVIAVENPPSPPFKINLAGHHQQQNAGVAVAVIKELRDFPVSDDAGRRGLANVSWPGRLETAQADPWILLDGAHNPDAMRAVRGYLEEKLGGRRLRVVFGVMADKDVSGILAEIAPVADEFIFTAPRLKRAADPGRLIDAAASFAKPFSVIPGVRGAVETVLKTLSPGEAVLITGSLFTVGEAKASHRAWPVASAGFGAIGGPAKY